MRIALVFDTIRPDTIGGYFERACRELGIAADQFWTSRNADRIPTGYPLYLRIDHGDYAADLPAALRPRLFYATDTHLPKSWRAIRRLARGYDRVACCHRDGAEALPNGAWVPVACDPGLHSPDPALGRRWDVAFIGTSGGVPRKFYVQALRERYPSHCLRHAPHTELGRLYGQSKIGFNFSIRGDVNMRVFEVACAGALLVTNRLPHDDLARLGFEERVHYAAYSSPRELFETIDYYLAHDAEREAVARRARQLVLERHTYRHRVVELLRLMGMTPNQEARACASS